MVDFQSMPEEYRHADIYASGFPINGQSTLSVMRSEFGKRLLEARKNAALIAGIAFSLVDLLSG